MLCSKQKQKLEDPELDHFPYCNLDKICQLTLTCYSASKCSSRSATRKQDFRSIRFTKQHFSPWLPSKEMSTVVHIKQPIFLLIPKDAVQRDVLFNFHSHAFISWFCMKESLILMQLLCLHPLILYERSSFASYKVLLICTRLCNFTRHCETP